MGGDTLEVLLIEDNPGDARLIEEMLGDLDALIRRVDAASDARRDSRLYHEKRLSAGLERLEATAIDAVLLDLGLPDSTGLDTLDAVAEATEYVPIVVLTGLRDESVGLQAIQRGAQDYLVKEEVTSDLLVRSIHHAMERNRQERARDRQVKQLASLNRLNEITQDVTHAVITTSEREDLEQAVCERFVRASEYPFAWIGEIDRTSDQIVSRVASGSGDGYLSDITIPVGDGAPEGPAALAVQTGEVHVIEDMQTDNSFEPWREQALEYGYRASAAVPITYESVRYGVLCLYATSPEAFAEPEVEILSRLGDVIGHAITAIERKDALVGDEVREFEFVIEDDDSGLGQLSEWPESQIVVDHLIQADEHLIGYGHADGVAPERVEEAASASDAVADVRFLESEGDETEFELLSNAGTDLFDAVAARGGVLSSVTVADGAVRFVVRFPTGRDNRQLVELVQTHCPNAVPHAQRTVDRGERELSTVPSVLQQELTDKQRSALETAYFGGYFEWPRTSTSEEVADRLGVTPATFTHHLRAAERKFFDEVFAPAQDEGSAEASPWTTLEHGSTGQ